MSFRGISSITGGFTVPNSSTRSTPAVHPMMGDGPFTLPRKGYQPQRSTVPGSATSSGGVGNNGNNRTSEVPPTSFGQAMFAPRPPMQPNPSAAQLSIAQLSGRIMSASTSRPGTGGVQTSGPTAQSQNPRAFGLDLASLLANLDSATSSHSAPRSAAVIPPPQPQQPPLQPQPPPAHTHYSNSSSFPHPLPPQQPQQHPPMPAPTAPNDDDPTRKHFPKRQLSAAVPQAPLGPRVQSAGRFMSMPKPTVQEDAMEEPAAHSPVECVDMLFNESAAKRPTEQEAPPAVVVPPDGSKGKMSPPEALDIYDKFLSRYERREILEYDEVYFLGIKAQKIDAPIPDAANFGYDDERGDYCVVKGDHIAFRYEVLGELGKGSFGQVLRVHDHKKGVQCALKVIRNKKRFHQQATVEIRILDHLRSRDPEDRSCTVRMLNYFKFRSHTIVTFEMHSMNLYELAKLNKYQPFAPALIKRFTAQILVAMSFMWREQIVHCDLKPENILLRYENKTSIKIIDFGSSCFESERIYTYIQSRFYRAPEIILGLSYGRPIDLWSLGCIICEMQMGYPVFPGESEKEQLLCIMEVLGVPPARMVDRSPRKKDFFDSNGAPKLFPNSRNKIRKPATKDIMKTLRTEDATFVDFLLCFLQWEPTERMTPNEAMRHPWIAECFQQDTVQPPQSSSSSTGAANSTPRPRLNSARPMQPQPSQQLPPSQQQQQGVGSGLPSIDAQATVSSSAKGVNAWRLTNRKIGSASTGRSQLNL